MCDQNKNKRDILLKVYTQGTKQTPHGTRNLNATGFHLSFSFVLFFCMCAPSSLTVSWFPTREDTRLLTNLKCLIVSATTVRIFWKLWYLLTMDRELELGKNIEVPNENKWTRWRKCQFPKENGLNVSERTVSKKAGRQAGGPKPWALLHICSSLLIKQTFLFYTLFSLIYFCYCQWLRH